MSALRKTAHLEPHNPVGEPYPCWSAMAEITGVRERPAAQDSQAMKEERIWRALLAEPPADDVNPASLQAKRREPQG